MMGDLTAHFDSSEFLDRASGARKDPPCRLLAALEHLRGVVGGPLVILSGYRTPEHNAEVGGARDSRHLHGDAADLDYGYARVEQALDAGFTGVGECDGWAVHVDVRPGPPVTFADC